MTEIENKPPEPEETPEELYPAYVDILREISKAREEHNKKFIQEIVENGTGNKRKTFRTYTEAV